MSAFQRNIRNHLVLTHQNNGSFAPKAIANIAQKAQKANDHHGKESEQDENNVVHADADHECRPTRRVVRMCEKRICNKGLFRGPFPLFEAGFPKKRGEGLLRLRPFFRSPSRQLAPRSLKPGSSHRKFQRLDGKVEPGAEKNRY